jgi:hypothetical protein
MYGLREVDDASQHRCSRARRRSAGYPNFGSRRGRDPRLPITSAKQHPDTGPRPANDGDIESDIRRLRFFDR